MPKSMMELKDFQVLPEKLLCDKFLNVGASCYGLIKKAHQRKGKCKWVDDFFALLRKAYIETSIYILKNFPLSNKCLIYFSALSPNFRNETSCLSALISLGELLPNVIPESEIGSLINEVKMYIIDEKVTKISTMIADKKDIRIDIDWWSQIFKIEENGQLKYAVLSRLVKALMSVFSGPLVEGTFNIMDDIIKEDRSALSLKNYEASSLIKYYLRSQGQKSSTVVPNHKMRTNIFSSRKSYQDSLSRKRNIQPSASIVNVSTSESQTSATMLQLPTSTLTSTISTPTFSTPVSTTIASTSTALAHTSTVIANKRKNTSPLKISKKVRPNSEKITNFLKKK